MVEATSPSGDEAADEPEQKEESVHHPPVEPQGAYPKLILRVLRVFGADPNEYMDDGSRWPSTWQQFLWDLSPNELAPNRDGIYPPPRGDSLQWAVDVTSEDDVKQLYGTARVYRKDADETTRNLEMKAARLATVLVALLTANVALIVFEITRLGTDPTAGRIWSVGVGVFFGLCAAAWLVVGLTRAVDADQRMGMTTRSALADVAHNSRKAMIDEADGYRISDWTRLNKANRLIDARAAVSRSMVCLVTSALVAVALAFTTTLSSGNTADQHPRNQTPGSTEHDRQAPSKLPDATPRP